MIVLGRDKKRISFIYLRFVGYKFKFKLFSHKNVNMVDILYIFLFTTDVNLVVINSYLQEANHLQKLITS